MILKNHNVSSLFTNKFILKIHYLKVMIRNPSFYKLFILFNNYNMANANQSLDLLILTKWIIIPFDHLEIESFLGIFSFTFLLWIINLFQGNVFEKNNSLGKVPVLKTINFIRSCNLSIIVNILYSYITFLVFISVKYFYALYLIQLYHVFRGHEERYI